MGNYYSIENVLRQHLVNTCNEIFLCGAIDDILESLRSLKNPGDHFDIELFPGIGRATGFFTGGLRDHEEYKALNIFLEGGTFETLSINRHYNVIGY